MPAREDLVTAVREGLPVTECRRLVDDGIIEPSELFRLVIPRRTLQHRESKGQRLSPEESDRVLRIARIWEAARQVFGSPEKAQTWLRRESRLLGGERPLDLLDTEVGGRQVEDALDRLAHGLAA